MSYQVLARKWRPHRFDQMVGQEPILRMLTNALDHARLHHAYLFTGTRGVGKTSLARIFAKCLNCEAGISSKPCDTCQTCLAIDAGKFLDLIEVDAASRTKVEDTRELLDNVQYVPTSGRFKIYLIDEVHMLSGHSFNALLKTLEEPPPYVKFLLATTDPKRLPITVLSRCLQFNLQRVPPEKILAQLTHICTEENIAVEAAALPYLARAADGSMRDALSLLDQAIAYCGQQITVTETKQMLGSLEEGILLAILEALAAQDGKALLDEVTKLAQYAPQFDQVLEDLLALLHQIQVMQLVPEAVNQLDATLQTLAGRFSAEEIQLYYQIALLGRRDLPLATDPGQGFEMIMLRMLAFRPETQDPQRRSVAAPVTQKPLNSNPPTPTPDTAQPPNSASSTTDWSMILPQLNLTGVAYILASNCILTRRQEDKVELQLAAPHASLLNTKLSDRIENVLQTFFQRPVKLTITIATTEIHTPAKQRQQVQDIAKSNAQDAIQADGHVKQIMDIFGATLDEESIKAL